MKKATAAGAHIVRLSAKHEMDPFAVVALLAIHALCDLDFQKLSFWNQVCDILAQNATLAA